MLSRRRSRHWFLLLGCIAAIGVASSCTAADDGSITTTDPESPGWFMAAEGPPTSVLAALVAGPIGVDTDRRCVWVEATSGDRFPLVFPVGTAFDETSGTVTLPDGQLLRDGDIVEMAGGGYHVSRLNDEEYRERIEAPSEACWGDIPDESREVWEINRFSEIVITR